MIQTFKTLALVFLCCCFGRLSAQSYTLESVPDPKQNPGSHYVSNPAGILSAETVVRIDSILGRLEDSATAQVAVVVLPSIGDAVPKDFANELFKKWGIGYAQNDNGLLMLFVLDQRRVEFETGYGLEGVLPDATCGIIQREKMVPAFRNQDYNAGMLAGIEAVSEILTKPEAAQEIYAADKYGAPTNMEEMDTAQSLALAFMLSFCLALLWLFRLIVRSVNSIKREIDAAINKQKSHFLRMVLKGVVIPLGFALLVGLGDRYEAFHLSFDEALLFFYAYIGFMIWDGRSRRELVFRELYGKMSEPKQYVRLQTATRFYWFDALFFPVPFLWFWYEKRKRLDTLRNHPRFSEAGHPLMKVSASQKAQWLTPYQKVEEDLETVQYDIWRNEPHNLTEAVYYESLGGKYTRCDTCQSKAVVKDKEEVLKAATTEAEGRSKQYFLCKACGTQSSKEIAIPKLTPARASSGTWSSASSSGWSSGSSYSGGSSSSSWGGGRSGGGGAGSSW